MMLQNLLSLRDSSGLVLVNDTLELRARLILDCFTNTWAKRGSSVHILSFDRDKDAFQKCFPSDALDRIIIHDAFSTPDKYSPWTWMERFSKETEPFTLVIDSLSTALIYHQYRDVYMNLMCLLRKAESLQLVMALLHTDVHEEHQVSQLCYVANTILKMYAHENERMAGCKIVHKKPGGRVLREDEEFVLTADLLITDIKKVVHKKEEKPVAQQVDPAANLTFNLRLSDVEKAAKDSLVLPYVKNSSVGRGKGEITYVMEREDDFDEEDDPDDDLNF